MSQSIRELDGREQLIAGADEMKKAGYRLSQACVTTVEPYDLLYSFARDEELVSLRLRIAEGDEIESITGVFPYAYLYENEMKDLFGIKIRNINVDFKGNFYRTAQKTPFVDVKEEL
ncbi:hypothetical protein FACS1894217_03400 [Clostridia bacterium]|nr:hypothetical protein FACS1894217_03400 [Clostridia bacterium]